MRKRGVFKVQSAMVPGSLSGPPAAFAKVDMLYRLVQGAINSRVPSMLECSQSLQRLARSHLIHATNRATASGAVPTAVVEDVRTTRAVRLGRLCHVGSHTLRSLQPCTGRACRTRHLTSRRGSDRMRRFPTVHLRLPPYSSAAQPRILVAVPPTIDSSLNKPAFLSKIRVELCKRPPDCIAFALVM